jgi:hypothetical protein
VIKCGLGLFLSKRKFYLSSKQLGSKILAGGLKQIPVAAVVIMACNRPDYLDRTLKSVMKYVIYIPKDFEVISVSLCNLE